MNYLIQSLQAPNELDTINLLLKVRRTYDHWTCPNFKLSMSKASMWTQFSLGWNQTWVNDLNIKIKLQVYYTRFFSFKFKMAFNSTKYGARKCNNGFDFKIMLNGLVKNKS